MPRTGRKAGADANQHNHQSRWNGDLIVPADVPQPSTKGWTLAQIAAEAAKLHNQAVPRWLSGYINSGQAHAVAITFSDGSTITPQITWVSAPINAGFFAYDIPQQSRQRTITSSTSRPRFKRARRCGATAELSLGSRIGNNPRSAQGRVRRSRSAGRRQLPRASGEDDARAGRGSRFAFRGSGVKRSPIRASPLFRVSFSRRRRRGLRHTQ